MDRHKLPRPRATTVERVGIRAITVYVIIIALVSLAVAAMVVWTVLDRYIDPTTPTQRKDLVNIFILSLAGVVGASTAIAAIGNLVISRMNLDNARASLLQQQQLDERHAQDEALQSYFEQIGELLTDHELMKTKRDDDPVRLLAQAQTMTILGRLDSKRKRDVILFLYGAGLISAQNTFVSLVGADLRSVDLRNADLARGINFAGANLEKAHLDSTILTGANFEHTQLADADLVGADLAGADLSNAILVRSNLQGADLNRARLNSADLAEARLHETQFNDACLEEASLLRASLWHAYMKGATLKGAKLNDAYLHGASLDETDLTEATMPNGQKYEDWLNNAERRTGEEENRAPL
jgi:uncharacterized protein YjbI with pentapeptide repeats